MPSAAVVAFAQPRNWAGGIESRELRRFMDEWDVAADTLERMGYRVGVTYRDTFRIVVWPDSFDVVPARDGASWGYYLLVVGRRPHLVPGSLTKAQLLAALTRFHLTQGPLVTDVVPTAAPSLGDEWEAASRAMSRLAAGAFPQLPDVFARELEALGCLIPQSYGDSSPHNVIRGQFAARGQEDWAALCSRDRASVILVHWGGSARCPREVTGTDGAVIAGPDRDFLQGIGSGRIGFSRMLATTDSYHEYETAKDSVEVIETPRRVKLDHDGIEDAFLEKGSTVWYCRGGKWIALAGAD